MEVYIERIKCTTSKINIFAGTETSSQFKSIRTIQNEIL